MPISNTTITIIDSSGNSIVVSAGTAIPNSGVMVMGSDGTNSHFLSTDTSGHAVIVGDGTAGTPAGGVVSVQGVSGGTTIPVSGTVTATSPSVGTTGSTTPTSATLVGGTDGTNLIALKIKDASTAAVAADPSLVVAFSPNSPLPTGAAVIGAVTQSGTWTTTVTQTTASNLNATVVGAGTAGTPSGGVVSIQGVSGGTVIPDNITQIGGSAVVSGGTAGSLGVGGLGTAGTPSGGVVSVQGVSGGTPLSVSTTDVSTTGALGALNGNIQVTMAGLASVGFQIETGTLIGTIIPEVSYDSGTTWDATDFLTLAGAIVPSFVFASSNTATAAGIVLPAGAGLARVRVSAYTSGTANATVRGAAHPASLELLLSTIATNTGASATDFTQTGTIVALNGTVVVYGQGVYTVSASITGTWSATLTAQGQLADLTWVAIPMYVVTGTLPYTAVFSTTTNGTFLITGGAYLQIRIIATAFTSGTVNVSLDGSLAQQTIFAGQLGSWAFNLTQVGGIAVPPNLGLVPVDLTQAESVFRHVVVSGRLPQIQAAFNAVGPATILTSTLTGTGSVAGPTTGSGSFSTGTGTTGRSLGVSFTNVAYSPHEEIYGAFTASFTTGTTGTYQRIGLYNATDGFSFGYNGTTFGLWTRFNSVDTFVAQTSWNGDVLSGGTTSKFTRNGTPEALVQTDINLYRVRFGWLGIAPVIFEVLSADGNFVLVHTVRYPNSQTTVSITNPYLPMTVDVNNNATGTTSLTITSGCWVAGTSVPPQGGGGLVAALTAANTNGNTGPATTGSAIAGPTVGIGVIGFNITGTWSATLTFQFSMDGNVWDNVMAYNPQTGAFASSTTVNGTFEVAVGGYRAFRVVCTPYTSGTAIVCANANVSPSIINTLTTLADGNNNLLAVANRGQVPSNLGILPAAGLDVGLLNRTLRVGELGTLRNTSETQIWQDAFEGSTVNAFWTQSTTTQTIAQATGVLTLNNSGITTLNTDSIITSQRQHPKYPKVPLHARYKANISANVASNHTLVEFGFGAPAGVTAIISNGCFFRVTAAGNLVGVTSYNGTENVSSTLLAQGSISTTSYYRFDIFVEDQFARFIVTDANEIPVVDSQLQIPLTAPNIWAVSHLPTFARVYVDTTGGGTAIKLLLSAHDVQFMDVMTNKPWQQQMASMMRHSSINPTTYAQTPSSLTAAPAGGTPSNTTSLYTTLGGDYIVTLTAGSENPLSVFAFTIPSPYSLYITSIQFSVPFASTVFSTTGVPYIEWIVVANCASVDIATGGGQKMSTTVVHVGTATLAVGTQLTTTGSLAWNPDVPLLCLPGTVLHLAYKVLNNSGATSGAFRGTVYVDGYFE
jgi:hypothetical protein